LRHLIEPWPNRWVKIHQPQLLFYNNGQALFLLRVNERGQVVHPVAGGVQLW
jgi:hypothetical protein